MYKRLKDKDYFKKLFADGWTLLWPNSVDITAETLSEESEPVYPLGKNSSKMQRNLSGKGF